MEIHELVRLLRTGASDRDAARLLRLNRRTVARYRRWAQAEGFRTGPLPGVRQVAERLALTLPPARPPQQVSTVEPYREEVAAIRARLEEVHGRPVSYRAVLRLVRRLTPAVPETFVRVEVTPGSEAQVDFGSAGHTLDPTSGALRKTWTFVLELSWSRPGAAPAAIDAASAAPLDCEGLELAVPTE